MTMFRRAKHRGTYHLRWIVYSPRARMLHIPRRGFLKSSSVLLVDGTAQPLPWLAHRHAEWWSW